MYYYSATAEGRFFRVFLTLAEAKKLRLLGNGWGK